MAIFPVFKLIIRLKIEYIDRKNIEFALVTWWAICLILELSSPNLIACFAAVVCILALFLPTSCEPSDTQTILQVIPFKSWDWSNLECVWFACEIIRIVHKKILNGPFSSGAYSVFFLQGCSARDITSMHVNIVPLKQAWFLSNSHAKIL